MNPDGGEVSPAQLKGGGGSCFMSSVSSPAAKSREESNYCERRRASQVDSIGRGRGKIAPEVDSIGQRRGKTTGPRDRLYWCLTRVDILEGYQN